MSDVTIVDDQRDPTGMGLVTVRVGSQDFAVTFRVTGPGAATPPGPLRFRGYTNYADYADQRVKQRPYAEVVPLSKAPRSKYVPGPGVAVMLCRPLPHWTFTREYFRLIGSATGMNGTPRMMSSQQWNDYYRDALAPLLNWLDEIPRTLQLPPAVDTGLMQAYSSARKQAEAQRRYWQTAEANFLEAADKIAVAHDRVREWYASKGYPIPELSLPA